MSPAPEKVKAIQEGDSPTNPSEVRSLLAIGNFCARYIRHYSDMVKPLRDLTNGEVPWEWGLKQRKALDDLKLALTSKTVLSYFDAEKHTILPVPQALEPYSHKCQ